MISHRPVSVRLVGGLGNQLFIYTAGRFLSDSIKRPLEVDLAWLNSDKTQHGVSLEDFSNLEGIFVHSANSSKILEAISNLYLRICRRVRIFNYIQKKFGKTYISRVVGFDSNLTSFRKPRKIQGYFQTWRFAELLDPNIFLNLDIKSPSKWYRDMRSAALQERPIIIHIRIGDYLEQQNSYFGILSESYYLDALSRIRNMGVTSSVWLFSDDMQKAKQIHPNLTKLIKIFVEAPQDSFPGEELLLMSLGSANVIANSTFSWWGAYLNRYSEIKIAPSKWFKLAPDPDDLIPDNWVRITSRWVHAPSKDNNADIF